jgi:dTDP-4-amino-4,6-dideoxygalactose transaminase
MQKSVCFLQITPFPWTIQPDIIFAGLDCDDKERKRAVPRVHTFTQKENLMSQSTERQKLAVLDGPKAVTAGAPNWPHFSDEEISAVTECLKRSREDWKWACSAAGGGPAEELESIFAEYLGRQHAVSTCGGGPALHIACMAAGVGLGDEVITTPYSWGQTSACILQAGGVPVFADISPRTLTLDPECIEDKVTDATKAIVLVHIYGVPADMDGVMEVARRHDLVVIEDCAQAQGSRYKGDLIGTHGDISCFSIGSGKNLAVGEGGMIATDERELYEKCLLAGMHPGRTKGEIEDPELSDRVDSLIYTYRIGTFSAALACRQMERLEEMNAWRRRNAAKLREELDDVPGIAPLDLPEGHDPAYHMIPWSFVPDDVPGVSRSQYVRALSAEGVPIGGSYVGTPIHLRRTFQRKEWWLGNGYPWAASDRGDDISYGRGDCPVAERRCSELDLRLGGGTWWKDVTPLIEQIGQAFRKVADQMELVKEVGKSDSG